MSAFTRRYGGGDPLKVKDECKDQDLQRHSIDGYEIVDAERWKLTLRLTAEYNTFFGYSSKPLSLCC